MLTESYLIKKSEVGNRDAEVKVSDGAARENGNKSGQLKKAAIANNVFSEKSQRVAQGWTYGKKNYFLRYHFREENEELISQLRPKDNL